jgi:hypothetical protein
LVKSYAKTATKTMQKSSEKQWQKAKKTSNKKGRRGDLSLHWNHIFRWD